MWLVLFTNIGRTCNLQKYAVAVLSGAHADLRVCFGAEHACSCTVIKHFDSAKFRIIEEQKKCIARILPAACPSASDIQEAKCIFLLRLSAHIACNMSAGTDQCRNRSMQEQINAKASQQEPFPQQEPWSAGTVISQGATLFCRGLLCNIRRWVMPLQNTRGPAGC